MQEMPNAKMDEALGTLIEERIEYDLKEQSERALETVRRYGVPNETPAGWWLHDRYRSSFDVVPVRIRVRVYQDASGRRRESSSLVRDMELIDGPGVPEAFRGRRRIISSLEQHYELGTLEYFAIEYRNHLERHGDRWFIPAGAVEMLERGLGKKRKPRSSQRSRSRKHDNNDRAAKGEDAPIDALVTLVQVAPLLGLSKRTLERYTNKGLLPPPDFRGGGGKANKWLWKNLQPALVAVSKRLIPKRFPASQII